MKHTWVDFARAGHTFGSIVEVVAGNTRPASAFGAGVVAVAGVAHIVALVDTVDSVAVVHSRVVVVGAVAVVVVVAYPQSVAHI